MAKRREERIDDDDAKRKPVVLPHDHLESFLLDQSIVRPTPTYSFLESGYLRGLYQLLHTNCLYMWLRGDFGPIDEPTITTSVIDRLWMDLPEKEKLLEKQN